MFVSRTKKSGKFNAKGRAAFARTPKYKVYKSPVQRVKKYTTSTNCFATLAGWFTSNTLGYYGYTQPYQAFPGYGLDPDLSSDRGMMAMCEGAGFRIPRYMMELGAAGGTQTLKPAMCRVSDTVNILKVQVTRSVHNATTVPFMIRTFVFQNTGKISPIWDFRLPFNGINPTTHNWYGAGVLNGLNLGYENAPQMYTEVTVQSGIRANPVNLFLDRFSTKIDRVKSDVETLVDGIQLDTDVVDGKSDVFVDSIVKVDPVQLNYAPVGIDGKCINNPLVDVAQREYFLRQNTNSQTDKTRVDHFWLKPKRRLEYEDEGGIAYPKQGDLFVVHMLVPTFEPCVDRSNATNASQPLNVMNCPWGQIQIHTNIDVFYTDGT